MTLYLTREDTLALGAQQLTDEFDDAAPPVFVVPPGVSRITQIIVATSISDTAADDVATAALQFRGGAVGGQPTITVASGGIGAVNTGIGEEVGMTSVQIDVDIPLKQGLPLQLWGLLAGSGSTIGNMVATVVLQ